MLTTQEKLREVEIDNAPATASMLYRGREGQNAYSGNSISNAMINIHNLRLRTYVGFNPEEKIKQQDVVINIEIEYAVNQNALSDHVEAALDYKIITKNVIKHVEEGHFMLLEKLTSDVLAICSDHRDVKRARVSVDKPHALRFADSVSLTLEYRDDGSRVDGAPGE